MKRNRKRQSSVTYSYWEQLRPFALSLIKGKKTPLAMKIVFALAPKNVEKLILQNHLSTPARGDRRSLFLNVLYDGQKLTVTTGTSLKTFSLDQTLSQLWDELAAAIFPETRDSLHDFIKTLYFLEIFVSTHLV